MGNCPQESFVKGGLVLYCTKGDLLLKELFVEGCPGVFCQWGILQGTVVLGGCQGQCTVSFQKVKIFLSNDKIWNWNTLKHVMVNRIARQ